MWVKYALYLINEHHPTGNMQLGSLWGSYGVLWVPMVSALEANYIQIVVTK